MVTERRIERSRSLFTVTGRNDAGFLPRRRGSLVDQSESGRRSVQLKQVESGKTQPEVKVVTKTGPSVVKNSGETSSRMTEDTKKLNYSRFPPLPTKGSSTPRKSKVLFHLSKQPVAQRRRLSVPEESLNRPPTSILKKRHSVSTEYNTADAQTGPVDTSVLWGLPWEREFYFPPISDNGLLVFLDKDGSLPPMLRRLSNSDTYNYSQEFIQALNDLNSRPTT